MQSNILRRQGSILAVFAVEGRRPVACRRPPGGLLPGAQPRQLIPLITEVYGLVSGEQVGESRAQLLLQRV